MTKFNMTAGGERRSLPRRAVKERGLIWSSSTCSGCLLMDMTAKGARLQLGGESRLPLRFELEIVATGRRMPVQLIWQQGTVAGVQFQSTPTWVSRFVQLIAPAR